MPRNTHRAIVKNEGIMWMPAFRQAGVSGRFTGQRAVVWLPLAKARRSGRDAGGKVRSA